MVMKSIQELIGGLALILLSLSGVMYNYYDTRSKKIKPMVRVGMFLATVYLSSRIVLLLPYLLF